MRKLIFILLLALILGFATFGHAELINNGGGLIYDRDLNITWYAPAPSSLTYGGALGWAAGVTVGGTVAGSWRLPTTPGSDWGYLNEGEMAHLYYDELNNVVGGPLNKGPFANLQASNYWSNTTWWKNPFNYTVDFNFSNGYQRAQYMLDGLYVMAVHEGDVLGNGVVLPSGPPVPIPGAFFLFGPGLAGLAVLRRRLKK